MAINYNSFNEVENETVYLCRPLGKIISVLQGINTSSFKRVKKLGDNSEISFELDKYIEEQGITIENPLYDKVLKGMELFINEVGYFIIRSADETVEDNNSKKNIEAVSIDSELQNTSLSMVVNYGTDDSLECSIENNIDKTTNKPLRYIKLYDSENSEFSLLDIILKKSKCNWKIGTIPESISNLELKIEMDNQDVYSFLTQDVSKAAQCIFEFDCCNRTINAHAIDEIGYDTGIYVSFKNLLKNLNIKPTTEQFYTRYNVKNDDSNIDDINFGDSWVEDLSYFMNIRDKEDKLIFISEDLRNRYYGWKNYIDAELRPYFIKENKKLLKLKNELYLLENGTPNTYCSEDWTQYTDEELVAFKIAFQEKLNEVKTEYRTKYHKQTIIDSEIKETEFWFDYFCYKNIIESITNEQLYRESIVDVWSGRKGDVNGDGEVDDTDSEIVAKFLKGQIKLKDSQIERADWNQDGIVDNNDLISIKRFIRMSSKESRSSLDYQTEWSLYGYEELKVIKEDYLAKLEDLNNLGVICYTEESDGSIKAINKIDAHALSYNDLAVFLDPDDGFAPNGETFTLNTPTATVETSSHGFMIFENIQNGSFELWKNASTGAYYDIEYKILDFVVDSSNQTSTITLSQDAINAGCYIEEYVNPITSQMSKYVHVKLRAKSISNVVGDTNGDGIVDTYDLILAEEMMNGETDFDMSYDPINDKYGSYQLKRADTNGDGEITKIDLENIQNIINDNLENEVLSENSENAKRYILYVNQINRQMKTLLDKINELKEQIDPLQKHIDRIIEYSKKDFVNDQHSSEVYVEGDETSEPPNDYYYSNTEGINRYFTNTDLKILSLLNYDTEYINDAINIDNYDSIIDYETDLRKDAINNLAPVSQPQLSFSASVSNLLALEDFKCFHSDFDVGNFIRLEYNDGYYAKLRVVKISYNSLEIQNDSMEIEFSNMIRTNVLCNDFASILDNALSGGSGGGSSRAENLNNGLTEEQVRAIVKSYIDGSDLYTALGNQYASKGSILKHLLDGSANGSLVLNTANPNTGNNENSLSLGYGSKVDGYRSAVIGGYNNKILSTSSGSASDSIILSGSNNLIEYIYGGSTSYNGILAGNGNKILDAYYNAVISGNNNLIEYGEHNAILGGNNNSINKNASVFRYVSINFNDYITYPHPEYSWEQGDNISFYLDDTLVLSTTVKYSGKFYPSYSSASIYFNNSSTRDLNSSLKNCNKIVISNQIISLDNDWVDYFQFSIYGSSTYQCAIVGGYGHEINASKTSVILGGASSKITSDTYNNAILAGHNNYIRDNSYAIAIIGGRDNISRERSQYTTIIGSENEIENTSYGVIIGYNNEAYESSSGSVFIGLSNITVLARYSTTTGSGNRIYGLGIDNYHTHLVGDDNESLTSNRVYSLGYCNKTYGGNTNLSVGYYNDTGNLEIIEETFNYISRFFIHADHSNYYHQTYTWNKGDTILFYRGNDSEPFFTTTFAKDGSSGGGNDPYKYDIDIYFYNNNNVDVSESTRIKIKNYSIISLSASWISTYSDRIVITQDYGFTLVKAEPVLDYVYATYCYYSGYTKTTRSYGVRWSSGQTESEIVYSHEYDLPNRRINEYKDTILIGKNLKAGKDNQVVFGTNNLPNDDAEIVIGNGSNNGNSNNGDYYERRNAIEIYSDNSTHIIGALKVEDDIYINDLSIPKSYIIKLELENTSETTSRIGYNVDILSHYIKGYDSLCANIDDSIYIPLTVCEGNVYVFSYYEVDELKWKHYKLEVDFDNRTYVKTYIENSGGGSGSFNIENLSVENNGVYTPPANTYYNNVNVNVANSEGSDTMSLYGQNYDINAVDLVIPGSIEYVKDSLYNVETRYYYEQSNLTGFKNSYDYDRNTRSFAENGVEVIKNGTLRKLILSEGVKQVGDKAFYCQDKLDRIEFPSSLEWVHGQAFYGTPWLDEQPLGAVFCDKVLYLYKGQQYNSASYALVRDKNYVIPKNTISISTYAFQYKRGFRNIDFYSGSQDFDLIGIGDYTFEGCRYDNNTPTIFGTIPSSVTWIGKGAFKNTGAAFSSLPNIDKIREATFYDCNFTNIDLIIPNSVKVIETEAFYYAKVTNLTLGTGLKMIGINAFMGNSNLSSLTIPANVQSLGYRCFAGCSGLLSLSLSNGITHIDRSAFQYCSGLTNVTVEQGFCADNLDISASTNLTQSVLEAIIDNLEDKTGVLPGYLIVGSTNLAKISSAKLALATSRNWTVS